MYMYFLYKGEGAGVSGVLPRKILENLECRKSHLPQFFRLILYNFIFHLSVFFIVFCYSLKFSGYSLYFKRTVFSNQKFICLLFSNQY